MGINEVISLSVHSVNLLHGRWQAGMKILFTFNAVPLYEMITEGNKLSRKKEMTHHCFSIMC